MNFLIAQTSQPSPRVWVYLWSNVNTTTIMAVIGALSLVGGALGGSINKAVLWCISTWFGWKSAAQKAQEDLQQQANENGTNIQKLAAAVSPNMPNPSTASIDEIAKGK